MRQLTALDQQFLALEDARNYGHVGALAIYDPSTAPGGEVTLPRLQGLIAPPTSQRLSAVQRLEHVRVALVDEIALELQ